LKTTCMIRVQIFGAWAVFFLNYCKSRIQMLRKQRSCSKVIAVSLNHHLLRKIKDKSREKLVFRSVKMTK